MEKKKPWLGTPQRTIEILQKYGFRFQKKFGQNFLIDPHVLEMCIRDRFMTEDIYQNLVKTVDQSAPESIHLCDYPKVEEGWIDKQLEEDMGCLLYTSKAGYRRGISSSP